MGEVIRGDDGPTAVHTKLGLVLSDQVVGIPPQGSSINLNSLPENGYTGIWMTDLMRFGTWRHSASKRTNALFMKISKGTYLSEMEGTKFTLLGRNLILS